MKGEKEAGSELGGFGKVKEKGEGLEVICMGLGGYFN